VQDAIRQEYHQSGRESLSVRQFPRDSFETVLARPAHVGTGMQRAVVLGEGLFLVSSHLSGGPAETVSSGHFLGMAYVGFNLSETPSCGTFNGARWQARYGDAYAFSPPAALTMTYSPFCRLRTLSILVSPLVLAGLADDLVGGAGSFRVAALAGDAKGPVCQTSRMTPEMRAVVERIDDCPFHGGLKKLYLEGKALELLALRLAHLCDDPPQQASGPLSPFVIERLNQARAVVTARMAAPPSLRELSREVALSTTLLKRGFRQLFGETVFEHLRNLRLDRARELLVDGRVSVKEAAWAVGYSSLSHFARAFGERFGASPHAWARAREPR
jgi:AraC-like DNA-binding protein